jgi:DNA polymerase-3 subunit delta'
MAAPAVGTMAAVPAASPPDLTEDAWSTVIGQPAAVAALRGAVGRPVHAWLFVGPSGAGGRSAARAFAAELFAVGAGPEDAERHRRLAVAEQHPDLLVIERTGAAIPIEAARDIVRRASLSPAEGDRKVMVLDEFHLVSPAAAATLLKTIEEPPPGTYFVILADEVTPDLVTIASRCARIDFPPLSDDTIRGALVAEGADPGRAAEAAAAAHGALDRARLLVSDDRLALRVRLWRELPGRLDGTGHTVATLVDEVRAGIDDAAAPLAEVHAREATEVNERIERYGQRGSGAKDLEARHRRAQRRLRTDELRLGFEELADRYRAELATSPDPAELVAGLQALQRAIEALIRNPSEELLLQSLLLRLPRLG